MGILLWLLFGLIVGAIAKYIVPGEGPGGILGDIIIGIVGAFLGGWIFSLFGHSGVTGFNLGSIICAIIGAVVLLFIIRAVTGRRAV
jgi:uncharacterized membrane protein YeaQ/YmgE (transglycosylase-associated protein family)